MEHERKNHRKAQAALKIRGVRGLEHLKARHAAQEASTAAAAAAQIRVLQDAYDASMRLLKVANATLRLQRGGQRGGSPPQGGGAGQCADNRRGECARGRSTNGLPRGAGAEYTYTHTHTYTHAHARAHGHARTSTLVPSLHPPHPPSVMAVAPDVDRLQRRQHSERRCDGRGALFADAVRAAGRTVNGISLSPRYVRGR
jgi:hypothetical protein